MDHRPLETECWRGTKWLNLEDMSGFWQALPAVCFTTAMGLHSVATGCSFLDMEVLGHVRSNGIKLTVFLINPSHNEVTVVTKRIGSMIERGNELPFRTSGI